MHRPVTSYAVSTASAGALAMSLSPEVNWIVIVRLLSVIKELAVGKEKYEAQPQVTTEIV